MAVPVDNTHRAALQAGIDTLNSIISNYSQARDVLIEVKASIVETATTAAPLVDVLTLDWDALVTAFSAVYNPLCDAGTALVPDISVYDS